jgi:6-phosphogluconolactonase (cycloisomerase 2 family)
MRSIPFLMLLVLSTALMGKLGPSTSATPPTAPTSYVITNDDRFPNIPTSATFFNSGEGDRLLNPIGVVLSPSGVGSGYFAANRVSVQRGGAAKCVYLSLAGSGGVAAVDIQTLQALPAVQGSPTDSGFDNGIGLANNGSYLYASFSTSSTIGTFAVLPGCGLQFLSSISATGLQGGGVNGMAVRGNMLVVTYGDGSIQSFNISAGSPESNNDLQNATGFLSDNYPVGVDITRDGHYAIFGDMSTTTTVEVSDISGGKLTKTVLYHLGSAANSNSVFLSPDETLLYIANNSFGRVTAAFFDKTTGKPSRGCTSPTLKGFDNSWVWVTSPVTKLTSGTGSPLYVAEYGAQSGIAVVDVAFSSGKCTLTEASNSPVQAPTTDTLLSIGVYPPRPF